MNFDLDSLTDIPEPVDFTTADLSELRAVRTSLEEVENGLSYARRLVQGRLDTLAIELDRRRDGVESDVRIVNRLSGALADRTRSTGMPRPPSELEPPAWADNIVTEVDEFLTPAQKSDLPSVPDAELSMAIREIAGVERALSERRHSIHNRIDRIQGELVRRYSEGASVDDLLATD